MVLLCVRRTTIERIAREEHFSHRSDLDVPLSRLVRISSSILQYNDDRTRLRYLG